MDSMSYANFEIHITLQQLILSMFHIQRNVMFLHEAAV